MRRIIPFLLAAMLVPTALAGSDAAGDGSLVVTGASASIVGVYGNGLVFGHIAQGTLTILDYKPGATSSSAQVSGTFVKVTTGTTTQYQGTDIRFLCPDGSYKLQLDGTGIDISAVGKGAINAIGLGVSGNGTMATNGGKPLPLGSTPTTLIFAGGKAPNAVPKGKSVEASSKASTKGK